jgi:hypothetical protein
MPKKARDKALNTTTLRNTTEDVYYADATPFDNSKLGVSTYNTDNLESLEI